MQIKRIAKNTMTPFLLNCGDTLIYTRADGGTVTIELKETKAHVIARDYKRFNYPGTKGDISTYGFSATLKVNGRETVIERQVGSQQSFYEPLTIEGVHLWLDAVSKIFNTSFDHRGDQGGFMVEKDFLGGSVCMPRRDARFVIQDQDVSLCPEPLHWWSDSPRETPRMENCYNGEDCWMGPYGGAFAHCGLDLNMPAGSKLYAPVDLDIQYYANKVTSGFGNNRWYGFRTWDGNVIWRFSSSHLIDALVPEHTPLKQGTPYATTAGTAVGAHEHTHFNLQVIEQGGAYMLDPWLIFWQTIKDNA